MLRLTIAFSLNAIAGVLAVAEPSSEHRGYSGRSSCTEVVAAETSLGSRYVAEITEASDSELNFERHELSGVYLAKPVTILVTCYRGGLWSVAYASRALPAVDAHAFEASVINEWSSRYDIPEPEVHDRPTNYRDRNGELRGPIPYKRVTSWCSRASAMGVVTWLPEIAGDPHFVDFSIGFGKQGRAISGC